MLLNVKDLKVHFEHDGEIVRAVDGIDFALNENEVLGLVGESGSGKTVTALSIMRLLPGANCRASGEILFRNNDMLKLKGQDLTKIRGSRIGMVFQEPFTSLNPVLTIGEQIDEVILAHRKTTRKTTKDETFRLLGRVRIGDPERIYDSYPHLLSGGERQRAMIAMAIALHPKILIADEPTTALDVTIQAEILDLIASLKNDLKMAVLFITHDFGIIERLAERVLVMKEGKIVEEGGKTAILSSPRHEYTKRLLEARICLTTNNGDSYPHSRSPLRVTYCVDNCPVTVSTEPAIMVKNLNKSFALEKGIFKTAGNRVQAVNGVNVEIKEGKTLGLVGESGSGKTTLGKLLMGLLRADSGDILRSEKPMQIIFQDPYNSLDPRMRMGDIITEGLAIHGGLSADLKKSILRDVLFKVHLNYEDRLKYPHQFSGGQRQRIAIARVLAVSPKILILDEPVSSLDVIIQKDILNLLKELQKELSLTYIFISHDLAAVGYMADEIAVMRKGEIVELGPRDKIMKESEHPYTKRLLASVLGGGVQSYKKQ